jgi:hypothetical protein
MGSEVQSQHLRKHSVEYSTVPEFIDQVFAKTSPKRSFSVIQNERFELVFVKTGSINSGTEKKSIRVNESTEQEIRFPRDLLSR